jgi:hypothetical protein
MNPKDAYNAWTCELGLYVPLACELGLYVPWERLTAREQRAWADAIAEVSRRVREYEAARAGA